MSDANLDSSLSDNHYSYTLEEHEVDKDIKFDSYLMQTTER